MKDLGGGGSCWGGVSYIVRCGPGLGLNARLSIRDYLEKEKDA